MGVRNVLPVTMAVSSRLVWRRAAAGHITSDGNVFSGHVDLGLTGNREGATGFGNAAMQQRQWSGQINRRLEGGLVAVDHVPVSPLCIPHWVLAVRTYDAPL